MSYIRDDQKLAIQLAHEWNFNFDVSALPVLLDLLEETGEPFVFVKIEKRHVVRGILLGHDPPQTPVKGWVRLENYYKQLEVTEWLHVSNLHKRGSLFAAKYKI